MVTEDTTRTVIDNLNKMNLDFSILNKNTQLWLEKLENLIQSKIDLINKNITSLKSISFDISSIAHDLNTSRQNLYSSHNGILKKYIELRLKDIPVTPFDEINKLKEEKSLIERDKELLIIKDVQNEILEKKLEDMNERLSNALKKQDSDFKRIFELENKLLKAQQELATFKEIHNSKKI